MSANLDINKLNRYADRFTAQVLDDIYLSKSIVGGHDLLQLTPVRQVNLGVLNRLFEQWKNNALSFRSVYFDFENEEVKHALDTFMNTASQHITVKREDLEPLVKQSVRDALTLLYTPEVYFEEKLKSLPDALFHHENARQLVKYTNIHQAVAEALQHKLDETHDESVSSVRVINWLEDILREGSYTEAVSEYEAQFGQVEQLNKNELFGLAEAPAPVQNVRRDEPRSFFDSALSEMEVAQPAGKPAPKPEPSATILSEIASKKPSPESESLNNRFKVDVPKPADDKAYGSVQVKVESIAGSIPLGQRFMFVNQLFGRNSEHFEKAIYELDNVKSYAEAEDLIWHRYASKHAWDVNGEAVSALLAIVKRKFAN